MTEPDAPAPPPTTAAFLRREWPALALFAALAALWAVALYRGNVLDPRHGGPKHADWRHWEEEVGELLRSGTIADSTAMYGYLPGAFVLLVPVAGWLPRPVGVGVLAASNIACLLGSARLIRRYWMAPPADTDPNPSLFHRFAGPVLLLTAINWLDPIFANQLSVWVFAGMVGGVTLVRLGRPLAGGGLLGLATAIKPPAGLLMVFCLWKREWQAAAGWCIGLAVFEVLPTVLFFGPEGAVREHRHWLARAAGRGHADNIALPWHAHRNQATSAVLRRWLRPLPKEPVHYVVRGELPFWKRVLLRKDLAEGRATVSWDPLPPEGPTADPYDLVRLDLTRLHRLSLADLDDGAIFAVWAVFMALAAAGLAGATFGTSRHMTDARWFAEAAAWMVAVFWFTPYLYHNYFLWSLPAVAVLWSVWWEQRGLTANWRAVLAALGLAAWVGSEFCRGRWPLEHYGLTLLASAPLAVAALAAVRRGGPVGQHFSVGQHESQNESK